MNDKITFTIPIEGKEIEVDGRKYKAVQVPYENKCAGCAFARRGEPCKAGGTILCVWQGQHFIYK